MRKLLFIFFIFNAFQAFAQPNWQVNYPVYQYNMTMTGIIVLDYVNSTDTNDKIGAFINGECRGVASPVLNTVKNQYFVDLVIYSNDYTAPVTFKVYDADKNTTVDIPNGIDFEMNKIIGSAEKPYYWSSPTLSSEAKFIQFNIPGQIGETQILDSTIVMHFAADFLLGDVVATFEVPVRTLVTVNSKPQVSGETHNNFTDTVIYRLVSADETRITNYRVVAIAESKLELDATNTITPNGDGINDYWIIHNNEAFAGYQLNIYTSGGMNIYSTTSYRNDWNGVYKGKTLPSGVYHYILKKGSQVFSGSISIIR